MQLRIYVQQVMEEGHTKALAKRATGVWGLAPRKEGHSNTGVIRVDLEDSDASPHGNILFAAPRIKNNSFF